MKTVLDLPRLDDRWSYLYLEHGNLDKTHEGIVFHNIQGDTNIPINKIGLLLLGPGTTVTHAAVKVLAESSCFIHWVGEHGVRLYAHGNGATFSSARLVHQARLATDPVQSVIVARRMFRKRFGEDLSGKTLQQIMGLEGIRVRELYLRLSEQYGVKWEGRNYDQSQWNHADPLNRALSAANSCLYGICHSAIVFAGYSAGLGFVHRGKLLSFVYDIADLYKTELTIPCAFLSVKESTLKVETRVRKACRDLFFKNNLLSRIIPDIGEVLDVPRDIEEMSSDIARNVVKVADTDHI